MDFDHFRFHSWLPRSHSCNIGQQSTAGIIPDVRGVRLVQRCKAAFVDVLGTRVHYLHAGSGKPVLLIHGLVGSSRNWRRNIGALAQVATVYAIDLANVGQSDRTPDIDARLEATADRVAATMRALGLDHADIAAHSHGGAVALMLAARHPQLVRSLILFAPANPFCELPGRMIRLYSSIPGKLLAKCAPYLPRPIQLIALGRMYGDPARIGEGCMTGYIDGLKLPGAIDHILAIVRGWFADMAALNMILPLVANIPTLLVWGSRDRAMSTTSGERLNQEMTASEYIMIPGGGHVVFEEMPEETNRLMVEWLGRDLTAPRPEDDSHSVAAHAGELSRPASLVQSANVC
jgi:4,5:9,10-diseco-3-hydroxy-5,9,17-trioxoandrosta-1(10),2-diene-4-oate hydrolase